MMGLGERIRAARLRRNLTTIMVAERAGISLPTLRQIEQGKATPSLGAYSQVLLVLGLESDLENVAKEDLLGQQLQDARLPQRARRLRKRGGKIE
jgi:transcriptional regulator with XRE-family HTH domain